MSFIVLSDKNGSININEDYLVYYTTPVLQNDKWCLFFFLDIEENEKHTRLNVLHYDTQDEAQEAYNRLYELTMNRIVSTIH